MTRLKLEITQGELASEITWETFSGLISLFKELELLNGICMLRRTVVAW